MSNVRTSQTLEAKISLNCIVQADRLITLLFLMHNPVTKCDCDQTYLYKLVLEVTSTTCNEASFIQICVWLLAT